MQKQVSELTNTLAQLIQRHCPEDGTHSTFLPRVALIRASAATEPVHVLHQAAVCIVAQGRKQVLLGQQVFEYDKGRYLVVAVDVPIVGQVIEASARAPYLCLRLDLDATVIGELLSATDGWCGANAASGSGLGISEAGPKLLDASIRLLSLLENPEDVPVLGPLVEREVLYWLLKGEQSSRLRQIAQGESRLQQVIRVINWLKLHYHQPFHIEVLAREACLSPSALYQHFKAVTNLSPLQYQKRLRLQEARRMMLANVADVSTVGHRVGYDSPSQFSREYSRLFGAPPSKDIARLRNSSAIAAQLGL